MADSNDEAKIKEALDKQVEDDPKDNPDESSEEDPDQSKSKDDNQEQEQDQNLEDGSSDSSEESKSTFTKPTGYEWVKGDTLEEFNQNLMVAYENSTKEALRLRQQPQATPPPPSTQEADDQTSVAPAVDPALTYAQSLMQKDMIDSFDGFSKQYPQAKDPTAFDQLSKAMNGVSQAFTDANGRLPTYPELFKATANLLGWQAADKNAGAKDAAIKEAGASTGTATQTAIPSRAPSISPDIRKSVDIARRIPGNADKSDQELMKELTQAVKA